MCWFFHIWIEVSTEYFLSLKNSGPFTRYTRKCSCCGLIEQKDVYDSSFVPTQYKYVENCK